MLWGCNAASGTGGREHTNIIQEILKSEYHKDIFEPNTQCQTARSEIMGPPARP